MLFNSLLGFVLKPESSSFVCEPSFSDHFLLKDCGDEGEFLGFAKRLSGEFCPTEVFFKR